MRILCLLAALGLHAGLGWALVNMNLLFPQADTAPKSIAPEARTKPAELLARVELLPVQDAVKSVNQAKPRAETRPAVPVAAATPPPRAPASQVPMRTAAPADRPTPVGPVALAPFEPGAQAPAAASARATPEEPRPAAGNAEAAKDSRASTQDTRTSSTETRLATPATAAATVPSARPEPAAAAPVVQTAPPRADASWAGNTPPPYPLAARRQGVQGTVRLDLLIAADGGVAEVRLRESSGSAILDHSVMQTVKRWRFIPATQRGQAVAAWYPAWEWVFRLEGGS
jgi:protein TonB